MNIITIPDWVFLLIGCVLLFNSIMDFYTSRHKKEMKILDLVIAKERNKLYETITDCTCKTEDK